MQKKTEGICFAISAEICWGSMGVAAQVLMEDSGFTVGDLVAGRLRAFLHAPIPSEVFFSTRRSKRHSALRSARPAHPTDVFLSDSVQQRRHRRHPRGHYSGIHDYLGYLCKASRTSDS